MVSWRVYPFSNVSTITYQWALVVARNCMRVTMNVAAQLVKVWRYFSTKILASLSFLHPISRFCEQAGVPTKRKVRVLACDAPFNPLR